MLARGLLVALTALLVSCVSSKNKLCGSVLCPSDAVCLVDPGGQRPSRCEVAVDVAECEGKAEGDACSLRSTATGHCRDRVCTNTYCGDSITDSAQGEVCDDGNNRPGDGCSSDCLSNETCGNGYLDTVNLEECDDGDAGFSQDGCSGGCLKETPSSRILGSSVELDRVVIDAEGIVYSPGRHHRGGGQFIMRVNDNRVQLLPLPPPAGSFRDLLSYDPISNDVVMSRCTSSVVQRFIIGEKALVQQADLPATPECLYGETSVVDAATGKIYFAGTSNQGTAIRELGGASVLIPRGLGFERVIDSKEAGVSHISVDLTYGDDLTTILRVRVTPVGVLNPLVFEHVERVQRYFSLTEFSPSWSPVEEGVLMRLVLRDQTDDSLVTKLLAIDTAQRQVVEVPNTDTFAVPRMAGETIFRSEYDDVRQAGVVSVWDGLQWNPKLISGTPLNAVFSDRATGETFSINAARREIWRFGTIEGAIPPVLDLKSHGKQVGNDVPFVFDPENRTLFVVGESPLRVEQWSFANREWKTFAPADGIPPPRENHQLLWDPQAKTVVLFGGQSPEGVLLDDTWVFRPTGSSAQDGAPIGTWSQVNAALPHPTARNGASWTWDAKTRQALLFGGQTANGVRSNETWSWSNGAWTQLRPAYSPPGRSNHDAVRHDNLAAVMIGGGIGVDGTQRSDTWLWNQRKNRWEPSSQYLSNVTFSPTERGLRGQSFVYLLTSPFSDIESCDGLTDADGDNLKGCNDPDCWGYCQPLCSPKDGCDRTAGPHCGDGTCSVLENKDRCPQDCPTAAAMP